MSRRYLTAEEAAAYLGYAGPSGIRAAVRRGELRAAGRGARHRLLFTVEELQRFARARLERLERPRQEIMIPEFPPEFHARGRQVYCYVVIDRDRSCVKFGKAIDPEHRLRSLQTGTVSNLDLMAFVPGGEAMERHLHALLDHDRISGEWFRASKDVVAVAEELRRRFEAAQRAAVKGVIRQVRGRS